MRPQGRDPGAARPSRCGALQERAARSTVGCTPRLTASVKVTLEITADIPNCASEQTKRAATENATALGFKTRTNYSIKVYPLA